MVSVMIPATGQACRCNCPGHLPLSYPNIRPDTPATPAHSTMYQKLDEATSRPMTAAGVTLRKNSRSEKDQYVIGQVVPGFWNVALLYFIHHTSGTKSSVLGCSPAERSCLLMRRVRFSYCGGSRALLTSVGKDWKD